MQAREQEEKRRTVGDENAQAVSKQQDAQREAPACSIVVEDSANCA
jgi:hypothetical protein